MARWKAARGRRKEAPPKAPLVGCVLLIVVLLAFIVFAFFAVLNPR